MNTNEQLKPCPFCGGEARIVKFINDEYYVKCIYCCAKTDLYGSEFYAIKFWNRRVNE